MGHFPDVQRGEREAGERGAGGERGGGGGEDQRGEQQRPRDRGHDERGCLRVDAQQVLGVLPGGVRRGAFTAGGSLARGVCLGVVQGRLGLAAGRVTFDGGSGGEGGGGRDQQRGGDYSGQGKQHGSPFVVDWPDEAALAAGGDGPGIARIAPLRGRDVVGGTVIARTAAWMCNHHGRWRVHTGRRVVGYAGESPGRRS